MSKLQRKDLTPEEIKELSRDLAHQLRIRNNPSATQVIQDPKLRAHIEKVLSTTQPSDIAWGGGLGAILGGGSGAILTGLARGKKYWPYGLANAVPGAIGGVVTGGLYGRQRRVQDLLQRKGGAMQKKGMLKEAIPRWRREGDEPFRYFLGSLRNDIDRDKVITTHEDMQRVLKELSDARGNRPRSFDEQRLLKWQYPELMKNPDPEKAKLLAEYMKQEARRRGISRGFPNFVKREARVLQNIADRQVPKPLREHLGRVFKSTPMKVLGALAALSALGYGTAKALESKTVLDNPE